MPVSSFIRLSQSAGIIFHGAIPSGIWMHSTKVENSALRPKLAQNRGAVIRSRNHSVPIQKRDCRVKISKNE